MKKVKSNKKIRSFIKEDIHSFFRGQNIVYLNLYKFGNENYISGFNYSNINSSPILQYFNQKNKYNNEDSFIKSICEKKEFFTNKRIILIERIINNIFELQETVKGNILFSVGIFENNKLEEILFEANKTISKLNTNEKSCILETIPLSNGLTGHILRSKDDISKVLNCTSRLYENSKKANFNKKSKDCLINDQNNNLKSSIFIQISFLPFNDSANISKTVNNFQTFFFMDMMY